MRISEPVGLPQNSRGVKTFFFLPSITLVFLQRQHRSSVTAEDEVARRSDKGVPQCRRRHAAIAAVVAARHTSCGRREGEGCLECQ